MKRITASLLMLLLVFPLVVGAAPALKPDSDIKVYINNERIRFDVDPIVVNGTTLVQFTPIFKTLGISYQWLPETQTIKGAKGEHTIRLQINDPIVTVNEFNIKLSAAPLLYDSRTLVPLRFVGEATGMHVDWNKDTKEVHIKDSTASKVYKKPDYTAFTSSVSFSTTEGELLEKLKVEPDSYSSMVYSFHNKEPFGYAGNMHVNIGQHKLVEKISYSYIASEQNKSVLLVYRDIRDKLEKTFGSPNQSEILVQAEQGYLPLEQSITDQELIRGIRNGTHDAVTKWQFSEIEISMLLKHDGNKVVLVVDFSKPR